MRGLWSFSRQEATQQPAPSDRFETWVLTPEQGLARLPESHEGSHDTDDEHGQLPHGWGSCGEFGSGGNRVLGDEEEIAGHRLEQFLARAVQGAGEGIMDGGGAVVVAEVNDEMAEGGRRFAGGGLGRLTSAARWGGERLEMQDGGFGPGECGSGGEMHHLGMEPVLPQSVAHLAESGALLDAIRMQIPHQIDQLVLVTIAAQDGLHAAGSADGIALGHWFGGEQCGEEQEWEGAGHGFCLSPFAPRTDAATL